MKDRIEAQAYANAHMKYFIVPDGVKEIGKEAFRACYGLRRIYIPKSVEVIEDGAFLGCNQLEIYCEKEPPKGWVCGMRKEIVSYEITTPEDDAFNFHRSGGSFTSTRVEREVERFHNWNPDGCPVHINVKKSVAKGWKSLKLFYLEDCPYCRQAERAIYELVAEHAEYKTLDIVWIEESKHPEIAEKYDYYYVPTIFDGQRKLYEADPKERYEDIKHAIEKAFRRAISNR